MATNRPRWNDPEFLTTFESIQTVSHLDGNRLFQLWHLMSRAPEGGAVIEVGVWRGGSGALIARQAQRTHSAATVYLCDTFEGMPNVDPKLDPFFRGGEGADTGVTMVNGLLVSLGLTNVKIVSGIFPGSFTDQVDAVSFAHVDVDVYRSCRETFEWIWPRLVPGGIVVFDDYGYHGTPGMTLCINEIVEERESDLEWMPIPPMQAVIFKIPPVRRRANGASRMAPGVSQQYVSSGNTG
jgi:O-methyltransferase